MPSDNELYREAMLLDFVAFNHRCFREINPTTPFDPNWHIEVETESVHFLESPLPFPSNRWERRSDNLDVAF